MAINLLESDRIDRYVLEVLVDYISFKENISQASEKNARTKSANKSKVNFDIYKLFKI